MDSLTGWRLEVSLGDSWKNFEQGTLLVGGSIGTGYIAFCNWAQHCQTAKQSYMKHGLIYKSPGSKK